MKRWLVAGAAALVGLTLIAIAVFSRETDEERIRSVLARVERAVHTDEAHANAIMRATQLTSDFREIFAEGVTYRMPELTSETAGRQELVALALRASAYYGAVDLGFSDVQIDVAESREAATARTRAVLRATRGGAADSQERVVKFEFKKGGSKWAISAIAVTAKGEQGGSE